VIGGNGFIGSPLVNELLGSEHEVAVFHRRSDVALADSGVVQIQGDRNRLSDYEGQFRRFSPDVIVDLILSSGEQARQLVETAHEIARRVIAISSMDVYRAWGVMHEVEAGPLDPLPLTEDSPLRTTPSPRTASRSSQGRGVTAPPNLQRFPPSRCVSSTCPMPRRWRRS
jgi:nucleoside-diphosphate-sugar epimerase